MAVILTVTCDDEASASAIAAVVRVVPGARYRRVVVEAPARGASETEGGIDRWLSHNHPGYSGRRATTAELHDAYVRWCASAGCEPMSKIGFARALSKRGVRRWITARSRGFILTS